MGVGVDAHERQCRERCENRAMSSVDAASSAQPGSPVSSTQPGSPISSAQPATAYSPGEADPPAIRFGVVGAGFIARWFLQAVRTVPRARVVAVTSARPESAAAFAAEHGIGASYATLEEMLAAGRPGGASPFDVVYIGSPNSLHASQTITALEAGFHVLVEKPFALDAEQAEAMVAAAAHHDRFLMEGWLTAFEPGTAALRRALPALLSDGPGPHRAVLVKEQYSSRMDRLRAGELPPAFDPELGGGSLMDLGVYPVSLAVHLFGAPSRITATGRTLTSGADSHGVVVLDYDRLAGARAGAAEPVDLQVVCLHSKTSPAGADRVNRIASDHRVLAFDDCQWPRAIRLTGPDGEEDLSVPDDGAPVLARELTEVCRLVAAGARESDLHPLAETVITAGVLGQARRLCS